MQTHYSRFNRYRIGKTIGKGMVYLLVSLGALLCVFPFYWMFVVATRSNAEVFAFPPILVPGQLFVDNVKSLLAALPFFQNYANSIFFALSVTALVVFFDSLAGFAFAKYKFPAKNFLFTFLLTSMMIPYTVTLIPWFIEMKVFGWMDSYAALIIPGAVDAFGIFWMRSYIQGAVPDELVDAARMDGANDFMIYLQVIIPIIAPAMGALAILTFLGAWNNLVSPLIILQSPEKFPLTVTLKTLVGLRLTDYGALMAGTVLSVIPIITVYLLGAKRFISGITAGSIQGM